jgi:hypothetical protein
MIINGDAGKLTDRTLDAAEEISKEPDPLNNTATSNLLERQMTTEN